MKSLMDLGVDDVHSDSSLPVKRPNMALPNMDQDEKQRRDALQQDRDAGRISEAEYQEALVRNPALSPVGNSPPGDDPGPEMSNKSSPGEHREMDDDMAMSNSMNRFGDAPNDEKALRGEAVEILLAAKDDSKPVWIQIAKPGKFRGHAAGPFEMSHQTFSEIINNFRAQKNQAIPADFEHASEMSAHEGSIPTSGAPAQGWVTDLQIRSDGNLWGLVEWLPLAKKYIRAGQYKYLSPAIVFGSKDRVTGKPIGARLSSIALTNNPFLDGMQPVAAKNTQSSATKVDMKAIKAISDALELPSYFGTVENNGAALLGMLKLVEQNSNADDLATRIRDGLRLPLTISKEEVFVTARIACGEVKTIALPIPEIPIPSPALPVVTTQPSPASHQETTNMTDLNKEKELATEVASLTLKLSGAEATAKAAATEHAAELKRLTDENAELLKKLSAHDERELTTLVDTAIATYGEKRGLTEAMRPHLLTVAKTTRDAFLAMYPPVPVEQRHLGRTIASGGHNAELPRNMTEESNVINLRDATREAPISHDAIAAKFMSDRKALGFNPTREEAFSFALVEAPRLAAVAAKKHIAGNGG